MSAPELIGRTVTAVLSREHDAAGRPLGGGGQQTGQIVAQAPPGLAWGDRRRRAYWLVTEDGRYFAVRGPFCDEVGYHSTDQVELFDGHEEPRYVCGFHASRRQIAS